MKCSLYVHIPFCISRCDYCDFFSIACGSPGLIFPDFAYIDAVVAEAIFYSRLYDIEEWNTIYIGGGTPSIMPPDYLEKLVTSLKNVAENNTCSEITVEMNPDDVTEELINSAQKAGVTRISMGIQALDDTALKNVNRRCTCETTLKALDLLDRLWKGRLSVDYIAGLPGQSEDSFIKQFEILKKYRIDHVSLYTLTVDERTRLYRKIQNGELEWDSEKADELWLKGRDILENCGFYQYEVSNFSKKGFECRHNLTYWNLESYIGIGAGASGTVYSDKTVRWDNTNKIAFYDGFWLDSCNKFEETKHNVNKFRHTEIIDKQTEEFEYLMMGFRLLKGISSQKFYSRFNKSLEERIGVKDGVFCDWQKRGLAYSYSAGNEKYYALNRDGIILLNLFLESLL